MKFLQKLKDSSGGRRMLIGMLLVILVAGALGVWWLVVRADREMRENQIAQTRLVAAAVNLESIKALTGTETDLESPDYLRLKEQLALIRSADAQCRFVYLTGRKADGSVFFFTDSEPADSKDYSPPGQVYDESSESFRRIFDTRAPLVEGPYFDRWGTWVSSLVPLTDPKSGTVLAVMGMDIDARDWQMNVAAQAALPVGLVLLLMIGLLTVLFAAGRVAASPKPVVRRLLPFLAILLLTLIISAVALMWQQQSERISESTVMMSDEVTQDLKQTLEQQARGLSATAQSIALDPRVREAMSAEDTESLLIDWQGLFETLHREQSLTHFYFIDANRVCLLRIHKPEKYGDKIERFTALEAERTGKPAWGIELGPLGTFTLRVVQPVFDSQRLVGYIELGKEIEDVWQSLNGSKEMHIAVSIKKDMLQRETWESGMRMLGREADWERLPHSVIIYASQGRLPDAFAQMAGRAPMADHHSTTVRDIADSGRDWRVTVSPLIDASGKEVGDLLIMVDVTDMNAALVRNITLEGIAGALVLAVLLGLTFVMLRRTDAGIRAQQAKLAESEIRFDQLAAQSRTITWETNADGLYTFVSRVVKKVLGYDEGELVGKMHFYDLHPEEEIEAFKAATFEVFARKEPFVDLVNVARCKTGETRWISTNGIPLLNRDGTLRGYRGSDTDITEQQLTNAKLAASEANFRAFFASMQDMVVVSTPEGRVLYANDAIIQKLGYTLEELDALSILGIHPQERRQEAEEIFSAMLRGERNACPLPVQRKNGTLVPVETRVSFGKWDNRDCVFGISKDLTAEQEAQQRFERLFHNNPALMALSILPERRFVEVNDAWLKVLGYDRAEVLGKTANELDLFPNTDQQKAVADGLAADGRFVDFEIKVRGKNGVLRDGLFSGEVIASQEHLYYLSVMIDITERKRTEKALQNSEEHLSATLRSIGDGVIACDVAGLVVNLNTVAEALTGWTFAEAVGKHINEVFCIVNAQTREPADNPVFRAIREGVSVELANHTALISRNGTERQIADSCAPIRDISGAVTGAVLVFRDVTEEYRQREEIKHLSFHDHLTGLFNRRLYETELTRLDTKRNWPLTIVMGDVNGLKLVNDTFGHNTGDQLLVKAAETIKNSCRADEIVARIGGDEFAILLPKTDSFEAEKLIKRIRGLCEIERIEGLEVSISFGYGTKTSEADDIELILTKAEDMMYHNKLFEGASIRRNLIDSIFNALNSKSEREKNHSRRVSELCERIGIVLGLEDYMIKEMGTLGLLHDIGKIAVSDTTLNKPGSLTEDEWIEMKSHAEIGYRILSTNNDTAKIAEYVLAHHERWDGKGYPKGLKGEGIPLQARIIAVADAYDAMTEDRHYRRAIGKLEAIKELEINAGTQFDPQIVTAFVNKVLYKE